MLFLLRVRELSSVTMPKVQVSSLGLSVCTHVKWKVVLGWNVLLGVSDKLGCSVLRLWLKAPPHGGDLLKSHRPSGSLPGDRGGLLLPDPGLEAPPFKSPGGRP